MRETPQQLARNITREAEQLWGSYAACEGCGEAQARIMALLLTHSLVSFEATVLAISAVPATEHQLQG